MKTNPNELLTLMTKREHFAAMAMQGLSSTLRQSSLVSPELAKIIAQESVMLADNLIIELNKEE